MPIPRYRLRRRLPGVIAGRIDTGSLGERRAFAVGVCSLGPFQIPLADSWDEQPGEAPHHLIARPSVQSFLFGPALHDCIVRERIAENIRSSTEICTEYRRSFRQDMPSWRAIAIAAPLERTSSLLRMFSTWVSTVRFPMKSADAISAFALPSATS